MRRAIGSWSVWCVVLALLVLPAIAGANSYVGSATCATCHGPILSSNGPIHARWQQTNHARIYDTTVTPAEFISTWAEGQIVSVSRTTTVSVSVTLHTSPTYSVTIGGTTYPIVRLHGAVSNPSDVDSDPARAVLPGHSAYIGKQRYHVRIGNSDYILPIQWNPVADLDGLNGGWVGYNVSDWFQANGTPMQPAKDRSEARNCAACHQTGVAPSHDGTEWRITSAEENIGCEACHGMGGDHAASGNKALIINPKNLTAQQANNVCGSCHSRGASTGQLGGKTLAYPYNGTRTFYPGDLLTDFYVLTTAASNFWGNGVSKSHHQQIHDYLLSRHSAGGIRCTSCHDPHGTTNEHNLKTTARNNALCLTCHASDFPTTADVATHTRHNASVTSGPRCVDCHMPAVQKSAVSFDIHAHTFTTLRPQDTLTYNMPNSCAIYCHRRVGDIVRDTNISTWNQPSDIAIAQYLISRWVTAVRSFWSRFE